MKKELLKKIMKRAWEIKRENTKNIFGLCLKMAWTEARPSNMEDKIETLKSNLEEMAYSCKYINAGIDRKVVANKWEKGGNKRVYLNINCYTAHGTSKGTYKCGYIDLVTGNYVATKWDDVNAENMKYTGR